MDDDIIERRTREEEEELRKLLEAHGWSYESYGNDQTWVVRILDTGGLERDRGVATRPLEAFAGAGDKARVLLGR